MIANLSFEQLELLAGAVVIVLVAYLILSSGTKSEKRLRERVQMVRATFSKRSDPSDALLVDSEPQVSLPLKLLRILGYRSGLPSPYRANLKIVMAIAGVLGLIAFKLAQPILTALPAIVLAMAVFAGVCVLQFRRKNKAYRSALFKQIPDTMSLMLRAVRAGLPVAEAIRSVGRESLSPTREEFGRVAAETALGAAIDHTLRRLYQRTGIQEYAFFAVVIGLHGQTGGNLAETLENLAETVRRRVSMAAKARALAAEGRMSAIVVGGLPFVVATMIWFMNPGYMSEFWVDTTGKMLVLAFAVLLTVGMTVTQMMVQGSTRD